jgi:hypothetical protein
VLPGAASSRRLLLGWLDLLASGVVLDPSVADVQPYLELLLERAGGVCAELVAAFARASRAMLAGGVFAYQLPCHVAFRAAWRASPAQLVALVGGSSCCDPRVRLDLASAACADLALAAPEAAAALPAAAALAGAGLAGVGLRSVRQNRSAEQLYASGCTRTLDALWSARCGSMAWLRRDWQHTHAHAHAHAHACACSASDVTRFVLRHGTRETTCWYVRRLQALGGKSCAVAVTASHAAVALEERSAGALGALLGMWAGGAGAGADADADADADAERTRMCAVVCAAVRGGRPDMVDAVLGALPALASLHGAPHDGRVIRACLSCLAAAGSSSGSGSGSGARAIMRQVVARLGGGPGAADEQVMAIRTDAEEAW